MTTPASRKEALLDLVPVALRRHPGNDGCAQGGLAQKSRENRIAINLTVRNQRKSVDTIVIHLSERYHSPVIQLEDRHLVVSTIRSNYLYTVTQGQNLRLRDQ